VIAISFLLFVRALTAEATAKFGCKLPKRFATTKNGHGNFLSVVFLSVASHCQPQTNMWQKTWPFSLASTALPDFGSTFRLHFSIRTADSFLKKKSGPIGKTTTGEG
jgi:hypothetical protein